MKSAYLARRDLVLCASHVGSLRYLPSNSIFCHLVNHWTLQFEYRQWLNKFKELPIEKVMNIGPQRQAILNMV